MVVTDNSSRLRNIFFYLEVDIEDVVEFKYFKERELKRKGIFSLKLWKKIKYDIRNYCEEIKLYEYYVL